MLIENNPIRGLSWDSFFFFPLWIAFFFPSVAGLNPASALLFFISFFANTLFKQVTQVFFFKRVPFSSFRNFLLVVDSV